MGGLGSGGHNRQNECIENQKGCIGSFILIDLLWILLED